MSDQARLPTISPLSPDVEALLVYEREIALQLDIVRARALARARHALHRNDVPSTGRTLFGHEHIPMPMLAGVVVATGIAAVIELLVSAGMRQESTNVDRLSDPVVDLAGADSGPYGVRSSVEPLKTTVANNGAVASDDGLEELRLLDRARQFDRRGDFRAALSSTREHQRRFSDGRLVEEREALRIRALIGLGRSREAGETAALFRRRFPHSVLLEGIDRMTASLR